MTTGAIFASVVVKIMAKTYPFQANATTNSATETSSWAVNGRITRHKVCGSVAPSIATASSKATGNCAMNARMADIERRVQQNQRDVGVVQPEHVDGREQRNGYHDRRQDADHEHEEGASHARIDIAGTERGLYRQQGREAGDDRAVELAADELRMIVP